LLTDWDKMSNVYREPSIDVSYQVLVQLAKLFQRRVFRNRTIRNKHWLWRSCLLTDQDEMSNMVSDIGSVHWVSNFALAHETVGILC
jgi:hypothetical protein